MEIVRMSLLQGEAGREILVQGAQREAESTATLICAYVQADLARIRRNEGLALDPARKPFWRPRIRKFVGGAALPLPCPDAIPEARFKRAVTYALKEVQDDTHLLIREEE